MTIVERRWRKYKLNLHNGQDFDYMHTTQLLYIVGIIQWRNNILVRHQRVLVGRE